ncbi:MAG: CPBP family intramembrane metalloprotease [Actinobacteria bacterium]|nr:CPBP family intramembrane metalloprotease [Actinomycetota bacterium]
MTVPVPASALPRRTLLIETVLVLGVSLGASAVWAVLSIIRRLTDQTPLSAQTATMNSSVTPDRPWLDLAYQLAGITLALVPVALALHLLGRDGVRPAALGLARRLIPGDLARGVALAALVGIPGLAFYLAARAMGMNTTVAAANLAPVWWAIPVLVLAAVQNAVLEEVVMIGYLLTRWRQAGVATGVAVVGSAVLRGTYHLYQGFGGFLGNIAMGLLFGWLSTRRPRVGALVVAHTLLDVVAFVGYAALRGHVSWL